ncbi:MAG: DUF4259 domain-containing protein [Pirellulales bacterium]
MGAWGVLAFDNDDANDWAYGLDEVSDLSLVESAFVAVEEADDYLEAPEACNALAACEVLCAYVATPAIRTRTLKKSTLGSSNIRSSRQPNSWLEASSVIDRIIDDGSELKELWSEDDPSEWLTSIDDLRQRVGA